MRLLFCTTDGEAAFNGINSWLLDFLPALSAAGHLVSVLTFSWSPTARCYTHPKLLRRGIPSRVVFPMLYTEAAIKRCLKEVDHFRPDVFVANHVLPALLALPQIKIRGVPGVSVLHNHDTEYRAKASYPADATVAVSRRILEFIPSDDRTSVCIPCGTPIPPITALARKPGQRFRLIYHGRIAQRQKRILDTCKALVALCRNCPDCEADLYGSGPDEPALREMLGQDNADGRVTFRGALETPAIRKLLPNYHACVLLSDYEGLPVAVLESMAAGLVPICLRVESGLPELIRNEENGLLVSSRDAEFQSAVKTLLSDPNKWLRLSMAAQTTVRERFSTQVTTRLWQELLWNLTKGRSSFSPALHAATALPTPHPDLLAEDVRYPGLARALWRWLRFGPSIARRPW